MVRDRPLLPVNLTLRFLEIWADMVTRFCA